MDKFIWLVYLFVVAFFLILYIWGDFKIKKSTKIIIIGEDINGFYVNFTNSTGQSTHEYFYNNNIYEQRSRK